MKAASQKMGKDTLGKRKDTLKKQNKTKLRYIFTSEKYNIRKNHY